MCRRSEMTTKPFRCDLCEEGIDSRRQASKHFHQAHGGRGTLSLSSDPPVKKKRSRKSTKANGNGNDVVDQFLKKIQRKVKQKRLTSAGHSGTLPNTLNSQLPALILLPPGQLIPVQLLDRDQLRSKVLKLELADHTYAKRNGSNYTEDPSSPQVVTNDSNSEHEYRSKVVDQSPPSSGGVAFYQSPSPYLELLSKLKETSSSEIDIGQVKVDRSIPSSSFGDNDHDEDDNQSGPGIPLNLDIIKSEMEDEDTSNLVLIKCDICHVKVSDLSTHLYTDHYDPAGNELITSDLDNRYSPSASAGDNDPLELADDAQLLNGEEEEAVPVPTKLTDQSNIKYTFKEKTGKYSCNRCKNEFSLMSSFSRHYRTVHENQRHHCDICDKLFSYRSQYVAHHKNVHQNFRFTCPICSKGFTQNRNLIHHQQTSMCRLKCVTVGKTVQFKIASYVEVEQLSTAPRIRSSGPKTVSGTSKVVVPSSSGSHSSPAHLQLVRSGPDGGGDAIEKLKRGNEEVPPPKKKRILLCRRKPPGILPNKLNS